MWALWHSQAGEGGDVSGGKEEEGRGMRMSGVGGFGGR